jgi:DUF1365 family protein
VSASCIYEGTIRHRRASPRREFTHSISLAYLDLEELPGLLDGRLLRRSTGPLRFRRRDYHGDPNAPLAEAVRDTVQAQSGLRPRGPIRLLTQLRSFALCFNPVSFYYCLSEDRLGVQAILAEVTNTPWRERHAYVLRAPSDDGRSIEASFPKQLHVSPFMAMDHTYRARASVPGQILSVHIESRRDGAGVFDATLSLTRRELTSALARKLSVQNPLATARVLTLIYAHAAGLKLAGTRVHPHPPPGVASGR